MLDSTSVTTSGLKTRLNPQNAPERPFENFETFEIIHFDIRYGKNIANYYIKGVFDVHDVTDDVTALRQIEPSIFMFKSRSFQPIVTKLGPYL